MPPARPRIDDSRSETSQSTMANFKHATQNGISKGKKTTNTSTIPSNLSRSTATNVPIHPDTDPNLPRTNWTTFPTPILHAYAFTHKISTPPSYTQPHAELLYKSSSTALRSPSQVATRRQLRDIKAARRRDSAGGTGLLKGKEAATKERERSSERLKQSGEQSTPATAPASSGTSALRQPGPSLAMAVRRHFNSAQVNEGDAIARFLYVVRHGGHGEGDIRLIGGEGDGKGRVIGSAGRAIDRGLGASGGDGNKDEGGGGCDMGFRLRFRPGN